MQPLPTGRQNFRKIIQSGALYIDKTKQIYDLIKRGKLYFLSRPRRFGKSLLVSTLMEVFQGNKDLFKGLYIAEKTDYKWQQYSVLQFNFAKFGYKVTNFESLLIEELKEQAAAYDITLEKSEVSPLVEELVKKIAAQGQAVVFLVDEYDKPIIDFITDVVQANVNRKVIKNFFASLKDLEAKGHLHFLFITGVSKFSKVSIFSELNNPTDLTIDPDGYDLLGITQNELISYFKPWITLTATRFKMSEEELLQHIKEWYNGYSWDAETFLYNPYSILNFFEKKYFGNFWFATGTPTFLVETIRDKGIEPLALEEQVFYGVYFDKFTIEQLDIYNLLFQTGYLTIKNVDFSSQGMEYSLGYPNKEVKLSFIYNLLEVFTYQASSKISTVLFKIQKALAKGIVEQFIEQLEILLSDISNELLPKMARPKKKAPKKEIAVDLQIKKQKNFEAWEGYFHTIIYLVTAFLGFSVRTEISKHQGRLDLVAETEQFLYLMEFKLDESAENAIQQIKERKYIASYKNSPKTIFLVGVGFSKEEKNVESWVAEKWER